MLPNILHQQVRRLPQMQSLKTDSQAFQIPTPRNSAVEATSTKSGFKAPGFAGRKPSSTAGGLEVCIGHDLRQLDYSLHLPK